MLGALAVGVLVLIVAMLVTVFIKAWPSFSDNGLSWFGSGGDVDTQLRAMQKATLCPDTPLDYFRAWPLIWGTLLTTALAVIAGARDLDPGRGLPDRVRTGADAAGRSTRSIRLLAGVPSVVYGLIGILALAPYINAPPDQQRAQGLGRLRGAAERRRSDDGNPDPRGDDHADHGRADRRRAGVGAERLAGGLGGARGQPLAHDRARVAAHGRPAIVAATVLATARALGEAIMLSMVSGGRGFAANPLDGITFLFEPVRPLAATIVQNSEGLTNAPLTHTIYAMAAVLLVSAAMLSFAGWAAKQPLKRYGIGG